MLEGESFCDKVQNYIVVVISIVEGKMFFEKFNISEKKTYSFQTFRKDAMLNKTARISGQNPDCSDCLLIGLK